MLEYSFFHSLICATKISSSVQFALNLDRAESFYQWVTLNTHPFLPEIKKIKIKKKSLNTQHPPRSALGSRWCSPQATLAPELRLGARPVIMTICKNNLFTVFCFFVFTDNSDRLSTNAFFFFESPVSYNDLKHIRTHNKISCLEGYLNTDSHTHSKFKKTYRVTQKKCHIRILSSNLF